MSCPRLCAIKVQLQGQLLTDVIAEMELGHPSVQVVHRTNHNARSSKPTPASTRLNSSMSRCLAHPSKSFLSHTMLRVKTLTHWFHNSGQCTVDPHVFLSPLLFTTDSCTESLWHFNTSFSQSFLSSKLSFMQRRVDMIIAMKSITSAFEATSLYS